MTCFCCGGPWHPVTGFIFPGNQFFTPPKICGACHKSFVKWLSGHLKRRWSKVSFYDHIGNSGQLVPREEA